MPAKGSTSKSSSGATLSQLSAEVESRLQALEAQSHTPCGGGSDNERIAALEAKVDDLINKLSKKMTL